MKELKKKININKSKFKKKKNDNILHKYYFFIF